MRCEIAATLVIDYRQERTQNAKVHHPPTRGKLSPQGDVRANMRCSKCTFDNPDGTKFCGQCTAAGLPQLPLRESAGVQILRTVHDAAGAWIACVPPVQIIDYRT